MLLPLYPRKNLVDVPWIFHDNYFYGVVDRSSIPGSLRRRDGSFHRTLVHVLAKNDSMEAAGMSVCKPLEILQPIPPALTRRARKLQRIKGNQYNCQAPRESVEYPAESCMDFHHQNEQDGRRSGKSYTTYICVDNCG